MPKKILIADDSPNIREILKLSLETAGYEVVVAEDGDQAMTIFEQEKPDLLIVDVMMPKANGFQICRKVKTNIATIHVPVILLTAKSQQEDVFWGKDCGADEYITKPFSTKELEKTIARLLRLAEDRQAGLATGVREEQRRRRAAGEKSQIVVLEWDPRAMDIYRKKYGEFKFSEAQRVLRQEAEDFLEDLKDAGPVDLHETSGLTFVMRGSSKEVLRQAQELAKRLNLLAVTFYTSDDKNRGYIPFRDPRTAQQEKLPLLSFNPRIVPDIAA
jgi:DNA-binding response OmpR family regulator